MKNWRAQIISTAVVAVSLFLTGCNKPSSNSAATGDVIKIGEFASMTGSEATFGQSSHDGTQLAVDDLNAAGGVLGKKLELHTEDDQSQAGQPATVVRKLISSDGVVAMLGEVASSRSLEAAPICQENKIPMISPSSTNPKVTEVGDYIFRVCFIDPFQGTVMANFSLNTLHLKNVAVLTDVKSDYSVGLAKFFKEGFAGGGGKIVTEQNYSGGDKDFNAQLTAIKAAKSRRHFCSRLLHGSRADRFAGAAAWPERADLWRRRLGIARARSPSAARRWKAVIIPRIFRRRTRRPPCKIS